MSDFYRTVSLPDKWPGVNDGKRVLTPRRPKALFKAGWGSTIVELKRECVLLKARDITLGIDIRAGDIRQDGGVRADARIANSDVVLSLISKDQRLVFPCDAFDWWQDNVRAIALAMGDLRRVDRYRVNAGRQYEGFRAIGAGAPPPPPSQLTREAAAAILEKWSELPAVTLEFDAQTLKVAARLARNKAHPDKGGTATDFEEVQKAIEVLERAQAAT